MQKLQGLLVFCIFLCFANAYTQYTGVINSNRPGFSESPYSVGTGVYQLETSLFFRKVDIVPTFSQPQSNGVDFLFRTGFFKERLEFNLNFATQRDQVAFENIFNSSYFVNGISRFTIAGKYLLYEQKYKDKSKEVHSWVERHRFDWKRLIPSVAVYAGLNTDFVGDIHKDNGISPKIGILLQNDISNDLNVVTNIFYDKLGTDLPEISYIVTATYSFNDRWSTFFENQSIFGKYQNDTNLGSGLAFLFNRNLQINSSLRLLIEGERKGFYTSFGVSYRLDKHVDELIELDEYGNRIEDEDTNTGEKKGFFGRIFSSITGVFKKKNRKQSSGNLKKSTLESIKKNTNKDENTINNDTLAKKPVQKIRTRPKRVRVKPSKIKPVKKKKDKKGIFSLFGKKSLKDDKKTLEQTDKELAKEQRKLEREIKKAEAKKKKEEERKKRKEKKKKKKDDNDDGSGG